MEKFIELKTIVNECDIALGSYRTLPPGIELAKLIKKGAIDNMKDMLSREDEE